jgi:hypothetical protein
VLGEGVAGMVSCAGWRVGALQVAIHVDLLDGSVVHGEAKNTIRNSFQHLRTEHTAGRARNATYSGRAGFGRLFLQRPPQ